MPAERRQRLEALESRVGLECTDAQWEDGFAALEQYVEEHTHARVVKTYKTADEYPLGFGVVLKEQQKTPLLNVDSGLKHCQGGFGM